MGFAPIFGRFCSIFLHLVQEPTPNFGEFRNKFCNIFVTILPHLFRFGETSFYGGKKCRFSSFSGRGGGGEDCSAAFLPSPSSLRDATSPEVRGKGSSATFLALPLGELSSGARLRGLVFPSATLPSPSRLAPCHLPRSGRQGLLLRCFVYFDVTFGSFLCLSQVKKFVQHQISISAIFNSTMLH